MQEIKTDFHLILIKEMPRKLVYEIRDHEY